MINLIKYTIRDVGIAFVVIPIYIALLLFAVLYAVLGIYYIIKYFLKH